MSQELSTAGLTFVSAQPGQSIVTMDEQGRLVIFQLQDGEIRKTTQGEPIKTVFSGDLDLAAQLFNGISAKLTGGRVAAVPQPTVPDIATAPAGATIQAFVAPPKSNNGTAARIALVSGICAAVLLGGVISYVSGTNILDSSKPKQASIAPERIPAPAPAVIAAAPEKAPTAAEKAPAVIQEAQVQPPAAPAPKQPAVNLPSSLDSRTQAAMQQAETAKTQAQEDLNKKGADAAAAEMKQLSDVLAALQAGNKLSAEAARQLPHEIAQKLKDAGLIETPEEMALQAKAQGANINIIKVSPNVMERYRDSDGVNTVPETNSWAAAGTNILLPLPGGGDIANSRDFAAFKLQP